MRLVVLAGSAQEEEDQQGIAHLLEHVVFTGTRLFPGVDILNYLTKQGLQPGADCNAHTHADKVRESARGGKIMFSEREREEIQKERERKRSAVLCCFVYNKFSGFGLACCEPALVMYLRKSRDVINGVVWYRV